jgi:OOP family OmpA-OmpF porin
MKIANRLVAAGALLALSGAAFAQSDNEGGWLIGGGIGQFNLEIDDVGDLGDSITDFDSDDMSWKIFMGYRFNQYLSVEGAYVNFGEPGDDFESGGESGDYSLGLSGFAPYVVGSFPAGPVELSARIGYYFYDVEVNADLDDLGGDVFTTDDSGEDVVYGVGIGMTFMDQLHTRFEYEWVDIDGVDTANAYWLTAAWRF